LPDIGRISMSGLAILVGGPVAVWAISGPDRVPRLMPVSYLNIGLCVVLRCRCACLQNGGHPVAALNDCFYACPGTVQASGMRFSGRNWNEKILILRRLPLRTCCNGRRIVCR